MASEQKSNKQIPNTDEILLDVWCKMKGWDDIIVNKLKELKITTLSSLKNNCDTICKSLESIDWNQCAKPKCICNVELLRMQAQECYPDSDSIQCDGCGKSKEKTKIVYHCKNNNTTKHEQGYDLCYFCIVINSHESFVKQMNDLKSQTKIQVKYPDSYNRHSYGGVKKKMNRKSKGMPIKQQNITRSLGMNKSYKKKKCKKRSAPKSTKQKAMKPKKIGFSVGGAKDVNSFRDNILKNNIIPQLNSITFEGLYYDYYFDVDNDDNEQEIDSKMDVDNDDNKEEDLPMFYPSYNYSKSSIPNALLMSKSNNITRKTMIDMIDDNDDDNNGNDLFDFHLDEITKNGMNNFEYFLSVGLGSNINEEDFKRKHLNLICVLDVSGSMGSGFGSYYNNKSKMKIANECILSILTHLTWQDRFGLILFDNCGWKQIQFKSMKRHKLNELQSILDCYANGGTNFESGWNAANKMFENALKNESVSDRLDDYENRIIFLTDACPNLGVTNPNSLMGMVQNAANVKENNKRLYTTFVGIGLDFNANLISEITKVRGANYFAVHSESEFYQKLSLEFNYFVSPMVFNLRLTLESEGGEICIDKVYGSNDININNGEIMNISSLFPSPPDDDGDIKGGIVLIKLKNNNNNNNKINNLFVECTFEDKKGKKFKNKQIVNLTTNENEFYPTIGTRKGILLTRYGILMKKWIKKFGQGTNINKTSIEWKQILKTFKNYFENEMKICNDKTLKQEIKILNKIINP